jgi:hypothetical protein
MKVTNRSESETVNIGGTGLATLMKMGSVYWVLQ